MAIASLGIWVVLVIPVPVPWVRVALVACLDKLDVSFCVWVFMAWVMARPLWTQGVGKASL